MTSVFKIERRVGGTYFVGMSFATEQGTQVGIPFRR